MIINSLLLKNYKKFKDREFKFNEGINVIYGPNEAGKTTIINAILASLYLESSSSSKIIKELANWESDNLPTIVLNFTYKSENYVLTKDYSNKICKLENLSSSTVLDNPKLISKKISEVLGVKSSAVYESTGIIRQYEVSNIKSDKKLNVELQDLTGGGEFQTSNAIKFIEDEISKYSVGLDRLAKNPGIVKTLEEKSLLLSEKYNTLNAKFESYKSSLSSKISLVEKQESLNSQIEHINNIVLKKTKLDEAKNRLLSLNNEILSKQQLIKRIEKVDQDINAANGYLSKINLNEKELESLVVEIEQLTQEEKQIEANLEELRKKIESKTLLAEETNKKPNNTLVVVLTSIMVLVSIFSFIFNIYIIPVISLVVTIIIFLVPKFKKGGEDNGLLAEIDEIQKLTALEIDKKNEIEENKINILRKLRVGSVEEFYVRKTELKSVIQNIEKLKEYKRDISNYSLSEVKLEMEKLADQRNDLSINTIEKLKEFDIPQDQLLSMKNNLMVLEKDRNSLNDQLAFSRAEIKFNDVNEDDVNEVKEELDMVSEQLKTAKEHLEILKITLDSLKSAVNTTASSLSGILKSEIEKFLPEVTAGNYLKVRIKDDFLVQVYSEDKKDWLSPEGNLSSGTIDEIYLLLRLAYFKAITKEAMPPIILDDSFLTFDEDRLKGAINVIKYYSKYNQILFFTCHKENKDFGHLISL